MNGKSRIVLAPAIAASTLIALVAWPWLCRGSSSHAAGETASIEPASQEAGVGRDE